MSQPPILVQKNVSLQAFNTFGIAARAHEMLVFQSADAVQSAVTQGLLRDRAHFVLGSVALAQGEERGWCQTEWCQE